MASRYSERSFWSKVKHHTKAIGKSTLIKAFTLYNTFNDERTPAWGRATIAGALAYLILPADAVPDFLPVVGFTDDAATLAAAAGTVAAHVRSSHKRDAKEQVRDLFSQAPTQMNKRVHERIHNELCP